MRCGLTGLRPTFGRVPRTGAMTLCWSLDKLGPMTRSVEDALLVLQAITGPDAGDPQAFRAILTSTRPRPSRAQSGTSQWMKETRQRTWTVPRWRRSRRWE
jgi:Asp-tRNA(Asn)/Glu-tRNA(Gln) amidotransferase A subunit family amidase